MEAQNRLTCLGVGVGKEEIHQRTDIPWTRSKDVKAWMGRGWLGRMKEGRMGVLWNTVNNKNIFK